MLEAKNILVTGGAGFIGSHFINHMLLNKAFRIINLDKLTYAADLSRINLHLVTKKNYGFVRGDIKNTRLVQEILEKNSIDCIVHFAAESHVDRSISDPSAFIETNVVGTHVLLEAALRYWQAKFKLDSKECRFYHVSTDEVYGSLGLNEPAFTENSRYQPNSPYSASKAASDHLVRAYQQTYGLPTLISHCSNNYGPGQHAEKFIPTVIKACLQQKPIPIYGEGKNIRDWLHVFDHCRAIEKILFCANPGEVYNIGGSTELSNLELAKLICDFIDEFRPLNFSHKELLHFVPDRWGHDFRYAISYEKIKRELGWCPEYSFQDGIRDLIAKSFRHQHV